MQASLQSVVWCITGLLLDAARSLHRNACIQRGDTITDIATGLYTAEGKMHKIQCASVQKYLCIQDIWILIISFISFSCPHSRVYIVYAIKQIPPLHVLPLLVKSQEVCLL